jgi:hypothetical protein
VKKNEKKERRKKIKRNYKRKSTVKLFDDRRLAQELVLEKETRIRETMLMMGLQQWILWSTWYLKQLLFLLTTVLLATILMKVALCAVTMHSRAVPQLYTNNSLQYGQIFPVSNFGLLFVFFIIYSLSLISFCFLVRLKLYCHVSFIKINYC